eukprot:350786-Chlamydomonas_euryale.AAC.1
MGAGRGWPPSAGRHTHGTLPSSTCDAKPMSRSAAEAIANRRLRSGGGQRITLGSGVCTLQSEKSARCTLWSKRDACSSQRRKCFGQRGKERLARSGRLLLLLRAISVTASGLHAVARALHSRHAGQAAPAFKACRTGWTGSHALCAGLPHPLYPSWHAPMHALSPHHARINTFSLQIMPPPPTTHRILPIMASSASTPVRETPIPTSLTPVRDVLGAVSKREARACRERRDVCQLLSAVVARDLRP